MSIPSMAHLRAAAASPVRIVVPIALGGLVLACSVFAPGGRVVAGVDPSVSCADVNGDDLLNLADPATLLRFLFLGGPPPTCSGAWGSCGDVNADAEVDFDDVLCILGWLFLGDREIVCAAGCENAGSPAIEGFTFVGCNAQGYPEYTHDATGMVFVRLPGGSVNMGRREGEPVLFGNETPLHEVTLSAFLIGKYEVTQREWHAVTGNYPSYFDGTKDNGENPVDPPDDRDRLAVDQVSWDDIREFKEKTGLGLPTEAQWEYAARAGTETTFSFGSGDSCADWRCAACPERDAYMWYCGNAGRRTREVGTKDPNPLGLHDVYGNVWEWCEDLYSWSFYSTPEAAGPDPVCTSGSGYRVCRGGGWGRDAAECRSANRNFYAPGTRGNGLGFRAAAPSP